ncbi:class I SAM-dependent methyltransferase [Arcanobacterium hippocoleae]|uniref:SAM-dependent methyltransferase n=1 Tax=Arcanobacterium hippocoleae TaxID=149017 RepID=A0ABU1T3X3_9ACTO|nr:class I SAM-dependent methyltransferase [Arcanobacterium hippocoleae]MDR6940097.1 SAM-dependent methyltransferase [Arcanobacterium hippocoleae]
MSIQDLVTPKGAQLLRTLPPYCESEVFSLTTKLRKQGHSSELISSALTQIRLRAKALAKFPSAMAAQMLFTADGLEQATRHSISQLHASHFIHHNIRTITDLGCGIGADSIAFAEAGIGVKAIEIDSATATAAQHNLSRYNHAELIHADGTRIDFSTLKTDAIWLDPARRLHGKRINDPERWQPSLSQAISFGRKFKAAGIKIAPGISYQNLPSDAFVTWISTDGNLLDAVIWLGGAAPDSGRAAWVIAAGMDGTCVVNKLTDTKTDPSNEPVFLPPRELRDFIYEPDPAIMRAGLIYRVAEEFDLAPVSARIAYLSTDKEIASPFLSKFKVLEVLPLNPKKARKRLHDLAIGSVEIKKRGTDIAPEVFRKALNLDRTQKKSATLFATQILGKHVLIIAERCK